MLTRQEYFSWRVGKGLSFFNPKRRQSLTHLYDREDVLHLPAGHVNLSRLHTVRRGEVWVDAPESVGGKNSGNKKGGKHRFCAIFKLRMKVAQDIGAQSVEIR